MVGSGKRLTKDFNSSSTTVTCSFMEWCNKRQYQVTKDQRQQSHSNLKEEHEEDGIKIFDYSIMESSSIEIKNALDTLQNLCVFFMKLGTICKSLCKDSNHFMCMTQLENKVVFWIISTENRLSINVKISISFLCSIAFKTYQSQCRSR